MKDIRGARHGRDQQKREGLERIEAAQPEDQGALWCERPLAWAGSQPNGGHQPKDETMPKREEETQSINRWQRGQKEARKIHL
jgi:hypothetical protein